MVVLKPRGLILIRLGISVFSALKIVEVPNGIPVGHDCIVPYKRGCFSVYTGIHLTVPCAMDNYLACLLVYSFVCPTFI